MMPGQFGPQSVAAYLGAAAAKRHVQPVHTPEFHALVKQGMDPDTPVQLLGWVDDFPARRNLAAQFCPPLSVRAPHLMAVRAEENIFLYKAWKDALGSYPKYVAQEIGDCTSFGSSHAVDLLQCVEIVIGKEGKVWKEICTEATYGVGREIAGMLGGGDGCYGVAVAKAFTDFGCTTREKVGPYDGNRAKKWGGRGGVPAAVKQDMSGFKVKASALITTLDELDAALTNGYPSAGGYGEGFTMHRDANGMCRRSGRWGHETMFAAKRTRNGRREYLMCQSWGPNVPDGPTVDDQPDFSWWMTDAEAQNILGQEDWTTFSGGPSFEVRPLPSSWTYSQYI